MTIEHASFMFAETADWIELDSSDISLSIKSEILIRKQVEWVMRKLMKASHLGVSSIIFPAPTGKINNFARTIQSCLPMLQFSLALVRVHSNQWEKWNSIRTINGHSAKLLVALEIDGESLDSWSLGRWIAEPVELIILPSSVFLKNKRGYPVLLRTHQEFIRKLLKAIRPV